MPTILSHWNPHHFCKGKKPREKSFPKLLDPLASDSIWWKRSRRRSYSSRSPHAGAVDVFSLLWLLSTFWYLLRTKGISKKKVSEDFFFRTWMFLWNWSQSDILPTFLETHLPTKSRSAVVSVRPSSSVRSPIPADHDPTTFVPVKEWHHMT